MVKIAISWSKACITLMKVRGFDAQRCVPPKVLLTNNYGN